ncbi:MAG: SPOR domain-containing protein [Pikeienuella sp.]
MGDEDDEFDGAEDRSAVAHDPAPSRVTAVAGAGLGLVCMGALGFWFYDLGTRDVSRIPVVAAVMTPVKVVPQDGAAQVTHGDIGSFDLGEVETGPAPQETRLAPPSAPISEEDVSLRDLEDILGVPTPARASAAAGGAGSLPLLAPDGTPQPADRALTRPAPSPAPLAGEEARTALRSPAAEPLPGVQERLPGAVNDPAENAAASSTAAPLVSPPAPRRPADPEARIAAARAAEIAARADLERRAAGSPFQIQLGAYKTEAEVYDEWRRIAQANTDLLNNRTLALQTTRSGGIVWYRLRVGPFASMPEALSLCEALHAREQKCIAVRNR